MITHLKARLVASAITLIVVTHPSAGHAQPAAVAASATATAHLPHVSIAVTGKGSPVILIPGLSSPRAVWDGVVPMLAKDHRVYLVQVNGFGGDAPGSNLAPGILDGIVADLHGYIAREKLGGAALVGHSLGGLAALMLAKAHPGDVGTIMVVDSLPFIGEIFVPGATVAMLQPQAAAMRDAMAATYGKPADPAMAARVATRNASKAASQALVARWSMQADPRVAAQAFYEDMTTDLRPDMAGIATPITLVYPWSADGVSQAKADALYKGAYAKAPRVTFEPIADSAHFVMLDQPEAFRAALARFLGK
jgi:pimeloyl-ACP methyl ester carboxylesterase